MELKILSCLLLFWITSGQSASHRRFTRSLSFLPSIFGGSSNAAPDPQTGPIISPYENHPIWRIHRYNGINLRPVSKTLLQAQEAQVLSNYGVRSTVQQVSPGDIPDDLRALAKNLGFPNLDSIPSLNAITNLLGTSSPQEAVSVIRDLARTSDGVHLIKGFISSLQQSEPEHTTKQEEDKFQSINTKPATFASNLYTSVLPAQSTLITAFKPLKADASPSVLHSERLESTQVQGIKPSGQEAPLLISFRQPSHSQDQRIDQTHILTGLPSVSQLPSIRGLESIPRVLDVAGSYLVPKQYLIPSKVSGQSSGSILFRAPPFPHINRPIYYLRPSWIPALHPHPYGSILSAVNRPVESSTNIGSDFEEIIGSASEQQAVDVVPPVSAFSRGDQTTVDAFPVNVSSHEDQALDVVDSASGRPQRISGVEEEAYSTGKIHTADMSAIDFPITTVNDPARRYDADQFHKTADQNYGQEERAFIERLTKLTSAH